VTAVRCEHRSRGPFETLVLLDELERSEVELAPARGGMVTRLRLGGREVLYLDEATFADASKNVRGGIPVLFPNAGKAPDEKLPQHGFARREAWSVLDEGERVTLKLESSDATLASFPFRFELRCTYALRGRSLVVTTSIANPGESPLPLHLGFHPYLLVPDSAKRASRLEANAARALDNRSGERRKFEPPDLTASEVDLHLLDPLGGSVRLWIDGAGACRLDYGAFRHVVVWTLAGKDFVCLEPWTAPPGALATGEGLIQVAPGGMRRFTFSLTFES
jgi:galactose mutarotase-like enzyme